MDQSPPQLLFLQICFFEKIKTTAAVVEGLWMNKKTRSAGHEETTHSFQQRFIRGQPL
jgi:hypothetical protein